MQVKAVEYLTSDFKSGFTSVCQRMLLGLS